MKNANIYTQQCPELVQIFNTAQTEKAVLCVPLDYAKQAHVACCVDGQGTILKSPFPVKNTPEGVEFLLNVIKKICRKHGIDSQHVIIGGEDCGYYAENFIFAVVEKGYSVFRVNAYKAKLQRENIKASTDKLDLRGIASTFLKRQGYIVEYSDTEHLKFLTRHRHDMVVTCTAYSNRMHAISDQLFPGFLDESKSGIPPFGEASLLLMSERFSPGQIKSRHTKTLAELLRNNGVQHPLMSAKMLKEHAASVLPPKPSRVDSLQVILSDQCNLLRELKAAISQTEKQMAIKLAQTNGSFATTMRGTGIVLAAQLTAELGNSVQRYTTSKMVSLAGLVPYVEQTGGPDNPGVNYGCPRNYNHMLKDTIMQLAVHVGRHGPPELMQDFHRRKDAGQNAEFAMARRYLRTYLRLVRHQSIYLPIALRSKDATPAYLAAYYTEMWPLLRRKWKRVGALIEAFSKENPLGCWRDCVQSLYNISLPLNGAKTDNNFKDE